MKGLAFETLDEREILRYLGCKKDPDPALLTLVREGIEKTLSVISPQYLYKRYEIEKTKAGVLLLGTETVLPGADLTDFIGSSHAVFLLCVTLGLPIEKEIRKKMLTAPDLAVVMDACATQAVEQTADYAQAQIAAECAPRLAQITERFSPGYGDLPLDLQKELLFLADAPRKMGLMVSDGGILTPQKSVTAIVGEFDR